MYKDLVPPIDLKIAYQNCETKEIIVVNETTTPVKRFPPSRFDKLYEIGTVNVSTRT